MLALASGIVAKVRLDDCCHDDDHCYYCDYHDFCCCCSSSIKNYMHLVLHGDDDDYCYYYCYQYLQVESVRLSISEVLRESSCARLPEPSNAFFGHTAINWKVDMVSTR